MSRVLIIGAGGVAGVVAHKCCQNPDVFEAICIASRTLSKCEALRDKLVGGRTEVTAAQVDADDTQQVIDLINNYINVVRLGRNVVICFQKIVSLI